MKQSTSTSWGSLKVGIVLVLAIVASMWASLSGGGTSIFESKNHFVCYFNNVNGLVEGSPIWMSGVEVGNIRSVAFVNLDSLRQVEVTCRVQKSIWHMITSEACVQLGTIGLLGDKFLEIIPAPPGELAVDPIEDMAVVPTRDAGSAEAMFKTGEQALDEAGDLIRNLDDFIARMNRGDGTLGQLATDDAVYLHMTELLSNLTMLTASLHENQERIVSSIENASQSMSTLTEKVNNNTGTLSRLLNDPSLYDNLSATSAHLDTIMNKINTAKGSMGLLVSDTALYTEMVNLLTRVNNLVSDIEENPRKYFKFSIF